MEQAANLSIIEAAKRLGISPHTLRVWTCYRGMVPHLRLGRRILFRPSDLDAFEQKHRIEARPDPRQLTLPFVGEKA